MRRKSFWKGWLEVVVTLVVASMVVDELLRVTPFPGPSRLSLAYQSTRFGDQW